MDYFSVADKLLGVPYKHNGRSKKGVDCWGLIYLFFKEIGYDLPRGDGFRVEENWYKKNPKRYINGIRSLGDEVGSFVNLQPLDLPYFNLYKNVITHTGVMLDDEKFLHVLINKEVRIDTMRRRFWKAKYKGAIRIKI